MQQPSKKRRLSSTTSQSIKELLPSFMTQLDKSCDQRSDLVLLYWPEIIGDKLAPMTKAVKLVEGTLEVKVFNSTLMSLLNFQEKKLLLKKLKEKFPKIDIKEIRFRLG